MNILVATDYSEAVMNAEHYAVQLAKAHGFFLRFLHVFEPNAADQVGSFDAQKIDYPPVAYELKKLRTHVEALISSVGFKPGEIEHECLVREGNPATQIIDEVKESFPNFVLMGAHGASGFREFVLGTQTWKVIKKAAAPVFVLPKDAYFAGIKNIVFATEYREGELPVIGFLGQLAKHFNANITVLHVTANVLTEDMEKRISNEFMHELGNRTTYPGIQLRVEHATDVINGIERFTGQSDADLVVVSHHKPNFLERIFSPRSSTTKKLSVHTHTPLLAIPDYYNPDFAWFWKLFATDYSMDLDF